MNMVHAPILPDLLGRMLAMVMLHVLTLLDPLGKGHAMLSMPVLFINVSLLAIKPFEACTACLNPNSFLQTL